MRIGLRLKAHLALAEMSLSSYRLGETRETVERRLWRWRDRDRGGAPVRAWQGLHAPHGLDVGVAQVVRVDNRGREPFDSPLLKRDRQLVAAWPERGLG